MNLYDYHSEPHKLDHFTRPRESVPRPTRNTLKPNIRLYDTAKSASWSSYKKRVGAEDDKE